MTPPETDPGQAPREPGGRAGDISRFFINRPVLSNVIALVVVLIGLVAFLNLPSAQYPNVVPPTVQVTTRYPGASARTLVESVALPIEQQVNGVEKMLYMQSTSADDGTYTLAVTFAIGTNPDLAQVLVQNRVAIAFSNTWRWFRPTVASTVCSCLTTPSSTCRTNWLASQASAT
jgi:HAE1 family hydrophobic/amphiphilic exporter-1